MIELKKSLGKKIQQIRKKKGFTQEKLAEIIGIEVPSMSNIETGKFAPSVETLQKLSIALEVKPSEFYTFEEVLPKQMCQQMQTAMQANEKLTKIMYKFFQSIVYEI